jgi:hypothetical protein
MAPALADTTVRRAYAGDMAHRSIDCWTARARLERWRHMRHLLDRAELGGGRLRHECLQAAAVLLKLTADEEKLERLQDGERFGDVVLDADL